VCEALAKDIEALASELKDVAVKGEEEIKALDMMSMPAAAKAIAANGKKFGEQVAKVKDLKTTVTDVIKLLKDLVEGLK